MLRICELCNESDPRVTILVIEGHSCCEECLDRLSDDSVPYDEPDADYLDALYQESLVQPY